MEVTEDTNPDDLGEYVEDTVDEAAAAMQPLGGRGVGDTADLLHNVLVLPHVLRHDLLHREVRPLGEI